MLEGLWVDEAKNDDMLTLFLIIYTIALTKGVCFGAFMLTSEEQKSQLTVSYDYLASIVLYSKYVIISQCTVMHVV